MGRKNNRTDNPLKSRRHGKGEYAWDRKAKYGAIDAAHINPMGSPYGFSLENGFSLKNWGK